MSMQAGRSSPAGEAAPPAQLPRDLPRVLPARLTVLAHRETLQALAFF